MIVKVFQSNVPRNDKYTSSKVKATDWTKCVLYLVNKKPLISPTDTGYDTKASTIQFNNQDPMPLKINLAWLDNGNGNCLTFTEKNAKRHKCCHLKFGQTKLVSANWKHKSEDDEIMFNKDFHT